MSLIPPWLRPPRVRERLASYQLRPDVLDAAAAMASDQRSRRRTGPNFSVPLEEVSAIQTYTRRGTGTVRIITPYGSLTVDQILGRQGEMLAADAQATIRGEPLPERDPLRLLAELRALRDSGAISAAEFEIRKSTIWREI